MQVIDVHDPDVAGRATAEFGGAVRLCPARTNPQYPFLKT